MISETRFSPLFSFSWQFSHRRLNKTPQPLHRGLIVVSTHHKCNSTSDETRRNCANNLIRVYVGDECENPEEGPCMDCMVPTPVLRLLEHNTSPNMSDWVLVSKEALTSSTKILQCSWLGIASHYWMFGTGWCVATFPSLSPCSVKYCAWGWASSELLHYFPGGGNCWTTLGPGKKNVYCK